MSATSERDERVRIMRHLNGKPQPGQIARFAWQMDVEARAPPARDHVTGLLEKAVTMRSMNEKTSSML
jgi:hypothetical protein